MASGAPDCDPAASSDDACGRNKVFPFNVESRKEFDRMLAMDVDGVIISDPIEALNWLKRKHAA